MLQPGMPTFERILERARALTSASANWEPAKSVGDVKTFSMKPLGGRGPRWWARVSEHTGKNGGNAFDQLWNVVASEDRYTQEKEYNPDLTSATSLKAVQWGEVWSLHYTFPPPISPRTVILLSTTHLETINPRVGWVISIPFDIGENDMPLSLFVEAGVKSNVISVDRFRELEDGKVEWLAASSTSPGGSIPLWLSEYYAVKRITAVRFSSTPISNDFT
ncbi:uncharacterized protein EI90DRAFT_182039 [Cantharellus anzutake]|uniref:uncharacterized protein n=1 Tax=Cantharellus anzutake TaxID=1750568 RepID=UPI00190542CD|nr:uncharacterized protein EI90DRAFT_182039 [Cantharellus anzutake]KAF8336498.1 hypothetical protein EI90DRAFT_182039 [Cantharellus anzutake]